MSHEQPTHLDLFSGIGGFALAARWAGFRTVAFCEIEPYAQAILKSRFGAVMADAKGIREHRKHGYHSGSACKDGYGLHESNSRSPSIYADIRTIDGTRYRGAALLTGGFPCQPFSVAGKRAGAADDRFLWPEMLRVVSEARPAWVLGENVAGIIGMELDRVLSDLEGIGYSVWPLVIPACAVDARHRRDRVWIMAHSNDAEAKRQRQYSGQGLPIPESEQPFPTGEAIAHANGGGDAARRGQERSFKKSAILKLSGQTVPDSHQPRLQERQGQDAAGTRQNGGAELERECVWEPEPDVGRVAHGVSRRVDRLKGLGNAIVPQVAFQILKTIRELI